ncbi:MAG TPA: hypothetical protein VLH75_00045 [Longimicrobiales bacterium]|nr:hypothetical protein [Longimicrobiales bacterium]
MEKRIEGSFPGGPTRRDPGEPAPQAPRLRRVEEIEERASSRVLHSARGRRTTRLRAGLLVALGAAFAIGLALGRASHMTQEKLTAGREAARARDLGVSSEVNRVLLELWRMEDIEAARNMGRIR